MVDSVIELIQHQYPFETLQARIDFAEISGIELFEKPFWYRDVRTGRLFYDIVACIGWADEITAEGEGQPAYLAIVGVVKPLDAEKVGYDATKAVFYILEEYQHLDIPTVLNQCVTLREKYGFGINRDLLNAWYGDPDRFTTALALKNEMLVKKHGDEGAVMVTPPDDYILKNRFEVYLRALKSVLQPDNHRLFFGKNDILKRRLREFKKDDPAVMAMGGLIHTMLGRLVWLGKQDTDNAFNLKEVL